MSLSKYRRWTIKEDELLKQLYNKKTLEELGVIFNRNWNKVCRRAIKLGIKKDLKIAGRRISKTQKKLFALGIMSQKGERNSRWKGGRRKDAFGYIIIYKPNHPNSIKNFIKEHRYLIEKKIGRYLRREEVVHHKNGIKDDNRIKNLVLCKNESEHSKKYHLKTSLKNISKTPSHIKHYEYKNTK